MEEKELQWDDTITKDASDFILLPEGDYNFTVESFERGRHAGSEKLPPCNKAVLALRIEAAEGTVRITHNLFLHSKTEGMLQCHEDICISHADKCIMASNSRKLVIKLNSFRHIS